MKVKEFRVTFDNKYDNQHVVKAVGLSDAWTKANAIRKENTNLGPIISVREVAVVK